MNYYIKERLQLNEKTVATILNRMKKATPKCKELLEISFLSEDMKEKYLDLLDDRVTLFD
ncbi:hypothetical protein [Flavobacterium sp.]|uniref:hypothetical protein n=1 Tax=Flavobacterium sp. TaxID=239 RepID=UPI00263111C9|nr:hypothetical protein [Flavobacterium sp.]MDG2430870.1 hypothetical protein [Flavobacterium sp.]